MRGSVAVVGGGPAGATCAGRLASAGFKVTLFEARTGGEKPCGGGVPGRAVSEFPELAAADLPRRIVRQISLFSPSNRRVSLRVGGGIHIFRRGALDASLRSRAVATGASLHAARVTRIHPVSRGRWEVDTSEGSIGPFDYLIGADGVRGVVRRSLAAPYREEDLTLALYAHVPGAARDEIVLKFFTDLDGYLWIFPRTDHVSVGICAAHRSVETERLEELLHRFLSAYDAGLKLARGDLRGFFIPSCEAPPAAPGAGSWALIGDAGGFVDPLTREGIAHAMRSGASLAGHLARTGTLRTPTSPADLRWARRYQKGFFVRSFLERMALLASQSAAVRRVLADLFSGNQSYAGLRGRLLMNAIPCGVEVGMRALASRAAYLASPFQ